jgi:peptide/nickel transport system permease protein
MPPDVARWAKIIANGKNHLNNAWWISTLPGLMIAVVVIAIGLMNDWARKRLNRTGWEMI